MALSTKVMMLISLLMMIIIFISSTTAADVAENLCGRTKQKDLCLSIIKADLRPNLKTYPNGIATILRDRAVEAAVAANLKIASLRKSTTDKRVIQSLLTCSVDYFNLINTLTTADFKVIDRKTYPKLASIIMDGVRRPKHCQLSFGQPPTIPSPLSQENESVSAISETNAEVVSLITCNNTACL